MKATLRDGELPPSGWVTGRPMAHGKKERVGLGQSQVHRYLGGQGGSECP